MNPSFPGSAGKKYRQKERRINMGLKVGKFAASSMDRGLLGSGAGPTLVAVAPQVPSANFLSKASSLSVPPAGSCNTTQTTAEVLSEANSSGGISSRISPLTKLARKLAGGKGGHGSGESRNGGDSSQRSSFRVRNRRHPGLSGQSSEESNDPGLNLTPPTAAAECDEDALSRGGGGNGASPSLSSTSRSTKRDKFSRSRAQMQCLNPLHLQAPSSVSKGLSLEGKDVELGAADFIDEGTEDEEDEEDDHNTSSTARLLGSAPANRVPAASATSDSARTFTVDLNETMGDSRHGSGSRGAGETIPLIPTSVGVSAATRQTGGIQQRNAYLLEDRRSSSAVNLIEGAGSGLAGKAANGAASASTTASPTLHKVPGLKPSAKNSSSGWL